MGKEAKTEGKGKTSPFTIFFVEVKKPKSF